MNFHFSDLTKTVVVISVLLADTLCIIPDLLTLLSLFAWVIGSNQNSSLSQTRSREH